MFENFRKTSDNPVQAKIFSTAGRGKIGTRVKTRCRGVAAIKGALLRCFSAFSLI